MLRKRESRWIRSSHPSIPHPSDFGIKRNISHNFTCASVRTSKSTFLTTSWLELPIMADETRIESTISDCGSPSPIESLSTLSFVHSLGYHRVPSVQVTETENQHSSRITSGGAGYDTYAEINSSIEGLAISNLGFVSSRSMSRVPSKSKSFANLSNSILSLSERKSPKDKDHDNTDGRVNSHGRSRSPSLISSIHEPYESVPDTERLYPSTPGATTSSCSPERWNTPFPCRLRRDIRRKRWHWLSITILILAIYSTTFSAIWLVVAALKPRYEGFINTTAGRLSPINASTLTAAFAKTIELSFVTVFVAFTGQVLSRRTLVARSKGITIAEMSTRRWVTQPGMMLTNLDIVKYAGNTPLGILSLLAVIVAVLYTTASDTLGERIDRLISLHLISLYCSPETALS